jgi:glycerol uptake facilitator protein
MIGLVVVAIGMSFGGMHGYAINPARDFGPRLFTAVAGFRNNGLTDGIRVWWVPVVAPLLGGLVGGAVYDFGIRRFLCGAGTSARLPAAPETSGERVSAPGPSPSSTRK